MRGKSFIFGNYRRLILCFLMGFGGIALSEDCSQQIAITGRDKDTSNAELLNGVYTKTPFFANGSPVYHVDSRDTDTNAIIDVYLYSIRIDYTDYWMVGPDYTDSTHNAYCESSVFDPTESICDWYVVESDSDQFIDNNIQLDYFCVKDLCDMKVTGIYSNDVGGTLNEVYTKQDGFYQGKPFYANGDMYLYVYSNNLWVIGALGDSTVYALVGDTALTPDRILSTWVVDDVNSYGSLVVESCSSGLSILVIVGISSGGAVLLICLILACCFCVRKSKNGKQKANVKPVISQYEQLPPQNQQTLSAPPNQEFAGQYSLMKDENEEEKYVKSEFVYSAPVTSNEGGIAPPEDAPPPYFAEQGVELHSSLNSVPGAPGGGTGIGIPGAPGGDPSAPPEQRPPEYAPGADFLYQQEEGPSKGLGCWEGFKNSPHLKSIFLTCNMIAFFTFMGFCETNYPPEFCNEWDNDCPGVCGFYAVPGAFWTVFAISLILYWVEVFMSSSRRYLSNTGIQETVRQYISRLMGTPPVISWHVQCYHYETRTVSYTDSNGNTQYRTDTYRVNTWSASMTYHYRTWRDVSGKPQGFQNFRLTQIKYSKTHTFANEETKCDYYSQMEQFKRNNDRDVHQDFSETLSITDFHDRMLQELELGMRPPQLTLETFLLVSFFFMTVPYRMWFSSICGPASFTFVKEIRI